MSPAIQSTAAVIANAAEWTRLILETLGGIAIALGAFTTVRQIIKVRRSGRDVNLTAARFTLARYLALALEFQLAADVLSTAVAPEWTEIGQLAAIAAIRTGLNYYLSHELPNDQRELQATPMQRAG